MDDHVLVTSSVYGFVYGIGNVLRDGKGWRREFRTFGTWRASRDRHHRRRALPRLDTPIISASHEQHSAFQELIALGFPGPVRTPIAAERLAGAVV